jgi:hypothetical protein
MRALLRSVVFALAGISTPGAVLAAQEADGLTGHLGSSVNLGIPQAGFQHGMSFYSSVYTLDPSPRAGVQLGAGTWLLPDNRSFNLPLCPVGTYARDNWPERGPSYRDVYQTLEGGVGQWVSTRFPSPTPKFRINATPDCYNTQLSTPGFHFYVDPLPANKLGIAQLSNRLLLPPDGIVPGAVTPTSLLGFGWLALPLVRRTPRPPASRRETRAGPSSSTPPISRGRWRSSRRRRGARSTRSIPRGWAVATTRDPRTPIRSRSRSARRRRSPPPRTPCATGAFRA